MLMAVYFFGVTRRFQMSVILSLYFNFWKKEVSVDNNPLLFTITESKL